MRNINLTEREEALASNRRYLARQVLEVIARESSRSFDEDLHTAMSLTDQLYVWSVRKTIEEER